MKFLQIKCFAKKKQKSCATVLRQLDLPGQSIPASLTILNNTLIYSDISNTGGIFEMELESGNTKKLVNSDETTRPHGLTTDKAGRLYFTDTESRQIKQLNRQGNVTVIAG